MLKNTGFALQTQPSEKERQAAKEMRERAMAKKLVKKIDSFLGDGASKRIASMIKEDVKNEKEQG